MTIQQTSSGHGVSKAFLDALDALAQKPSWWRDVLLRDDVFIAVRANSLNVYHRGASIFRIDDGGDGRILPWTHTKYLIRQQQVLAQLHEDGRFEPSDIGWSQYAGPSTLSDMIRSATDLAGAEKSGLHPLIMGSSKVIDVELSLLRASSSVDESLPDTNVPSTDASSRERGYVTLTPEKAPPDLTLYFPDFRSLRIMPVYLCNGTDAPIHDIAVRTIGITTKFTVPAPVADETGPASEQPLSTTPTAFSLDLLDTRHAAVVDRYDPMFDSDFVTAFEITFLDQHEQRHRLTASLRTAPLSSAYVALKK